MNKGSNKKLSREPMVTCIEVNYPKDKEIAYEVDSIIQRACEMDLLQAEEEEKSSILLQLKEMYWGPGLRVIFYNSSFFWLLTFAAYILICFCGNLFALKEVQHFSLVFLATPLCMLLFVFLSLYLDESEKLVELKGSLHYSTNYIIGLRSFYVAILMILMNIALAGVFCSWGGRMFLSLGAFGATSNLFFAAATVYLYHRYSGLGYFGFLAGGWCLLAVGMLRMPEKYYQIIFVNIPFGVHCLVTMICLVGFIILIERLEEKDAYSFAR